MTGPAGMTGPGGGVPTPEQRAELVEEAARDILLHGMTGPAVLFLQASMPEGALPGSAMTFFDPVLRRLFGGDSPPATAILADELGIEQLIDRLEELDEDLSWDA